MLALGVTDHEVTQEEAEKGATLPVPRFNTPAIAYVLAADLKKGDTVEVALFNEDKSLLHNTQTFERGTGEALPASRDDAACLPAAGRKEAIAPR